MKNYLKWFAIFAVVLTGLTLIVWLSTKNIKSDHIRVVIAERTFKIPKGYLDGGKALGKDTESIVLEYSLPGFEVLPTHPEERLARQKLINEGLMRIMLLESAANRPPVSMMAGNFITNRNATLIDENLYGLEKHEFEVAEGIYARKDDDIFLEKVDDGEVVSFLRCSLPSKVTLPSCRHKFANKGVLYEIDWPIRELPNWKEQQKAAIAFIDSFEKINTDTKGE